MQRVDPELTSNARALRALATDTERLLWRHLRILRPRFTRQHVVGSYITDFACRSVRVVIELDGGQHADSEPADRRRTARFEAEGWRVLRFWNTDVSENVEAVILSIMTATGTQVSTHPQPLPSTEGSRSRHR